MRAGRSHRRPRPSEWLRRARRRTRPPTEALPAPRRQETRGSPNPRHTRRRERRSHRRRFGARRSPRLQAGAWSDGVYHSFEGAGFRLVTLTNSSPATVEAQLKNAGLSGFFERSFSVDAVKRFKPAPEPYRYVANELGVATSDLRMVAAHAWDIVGSLQAGCVAAFI